MCSVLCVAVKPVENTVIFVRQEQEIIFKKADVKENQIDILEVTKAVMEIKTTVAGLTTE